MQILETSFSIIISFLTGIIYEILTTLVMIGFIVILTKIIIEIAKKTLVKTMSGGKYKKSPQRIKTVQLLITNLIRYIAATIILFVVITACGVPGKSLIAGAGMFGIVIGIGAKELIQDLVNGFFIILEGTYDIGEYVSISTNEGYVYDLRVKSTILKTYNNELVTIPNSNVQEVINYSKNIFKLYYFFDISYQIEQKELRNIIDSAILQKAMQNEDIDSIEYLGIDKLTSSGSTHCLEIELLPEKRFKIKRFINELVCNSIDLGVINVAYEKIIIETNKEYNA